MADPLYAAQAGSPVSYLTADVGVADVTIYIDDSGNLPAPPNLATLGTGAITEVILYTTLAAGEIGGITRDYVGTGARSWVTGDPISRRHTSYDHDSFIDNIETGSFDGGDL